MPRRGSDQAINDEVSLPVRISSSDVHVWKVLVDLPSPRIAALERVLSASERQRAGRIKIETVRRAWTVTRAALRLIVSRYAGGSPQDVVFQTDPLGKPFLHRPVVDPPLTFNVTHSGALALCAVGVSRRIGIDVELIRSRIDHAALARRVCSRRERLWLETLPEHERLMAFFACWTCKEAYVKAIGQGLRFPLAAISVLCHSNGFPRSLHIEDSLEEARRWSLQCWSPAPNYLAALVAEGQDWHHRCWDWNGDELCAHREAREMRDCS